MKKKLALLLALVIALGAVFFAGCTKNKDDDKKKSEKKQELEDIIEGKWQYSIDAEKYLENLFGNGDEAELLEYCDFEGIKLKYTYEFDDGEMSMSLDKTSFKKFKNELVSGIKEYYEDAIGQEIGDEELEEIEEEWDEMADSDEVLYYRVDGKKIYLAEDEDDLEDSEGYMQCTVQSNTKIKVTKVEGSDGAALEGIVPFTMTKK